MNYAAQLPYDPFGQPLPAPLYKSAGTQAITLTSNAVVYASNAFSGLSKVLPSLVLGAAGADTITFTSNLADSEGERISIQVAGAAGALAISVTGKAILITPTASSTCADVAAAIAAMPQAAELVSVTYTLETAIIDATQAKAYLSGYDKGNVSIPVRVWLTNDGFIGTYSEAETATKAASIPVTAKSDFWLTVEPGDKISVKSATNGAIAYITPFKQL